MKDFGFVFRMLKSSKNWLVVVAAYVLHTVGVEPELIAKVVAFMGSAAIAGHAVEDAAFKLAKKK